MPRRRSLCFALLASALLTATVPALHASAAAPESAPAKAADPRTGRLLVRYRTGAAVAARQAAAGAVRASVVAQVPRLDVDVLRPASLESALATMRARPDVVWAAPEAKVFRFATEASDPPERAEIGVASLPPGVTGAGTKVGVIDDGIFRGVADLPDSRLVDGGNCSGNSCENTGGLNAPTDSGFGAHGTAVAAIIAGQANVTPADDGEGINGVAPGAIIHSYRIFAEADQSAPSSDLAVANAVLAAATDHLDVVNMSLGSGFDSPLLRDAFAEARTISPNTVWVAASGNDGSERPSYPAGSQHVLSVGATELRSGQWRLADFSNRGDVDVLAPGVGIVTWFTEAFTRPTTLMALDGTSFAAPMVAGMAAVLASAGITGDRARAALAASAEPANDTGFMSPPAPPAAHGLGRADATAAYNLATGTAKYTAVFVDGGEYVAAEVGKRRVEAIRVGTPVAAPNLTTNFGTITPTSTGAAPAPNNTTTAHTFATLTAPASVGGAWEVTGSVGGDAGTSHRPLTLATKSNGPEGVPIASGAVQSPTTKLTFGAQSSYIRTFALGAEGCVDLDFVYPDESPGALLFTWAPQTPGGAARSSDIPDGVDDTDVNEGVYRYCATGHPAGTYAAGFILFDESGNQGSAPYVLGAHYPVMTSSLSSPSVSTDVSANPTFPMSFFSTTPNVKWDVQYTYRQRNAAGIYSIGAWRPWRTNVDPTAVFGASSPASIPGATYFLRARAHDSSNKLGPWSSFKQTVVPLDDRYHYVQYSAGWSKPSGSGRYQGTLSESSQAGRSLTLPADTAGFTIIGDKCPSCGQLRVFVDGGLRAVVDTRASALQTRRQLFYTGAFSSIGRHTLRLEVVGTPGRPRVVIDGIAIIR